MRQSVRSVVHASFDRALDRQVELRPTLRIDALQHSFGHQANQLCADNLDARRDPIEGLRRTGDVGGDEIHADLHSRADLQPEGSKTRVAHVGRHPPGHRYVGCLQPHVIGHQHLPRADTTGAGRRVRHDRPVVGSQCRERRSADIGQRALRAVDETWHRVRAGQPGRELVTLQHRFVDCGAVEWDERNDINDTEARMNAIVIGHVQLFDGELSQRSRSLHTSQCEDRPMMINVDVDVKQISAAGCRQAIEGVIAAALTDVDDAFEHAGIRARPRTADPLRIAGGSVTHMLAFLDSPAEIGILVVVIVLLFGGSQIPKLAKSLGQAQKEFKKGLADGSKDEDESATPDTK